MTFTDGVV